MSKRLLSLAALSLALARAGATRPTRSRSASSARCPARTAHRRATSATGSSSRSSSAAARSAACRPEVIVGDDQFKPDVGKQLAERDAQARPGRLRDRHRVLEHHARGRAGGLRASKTFYVSPNAGALAARRQAVQPATSSPSRGTNDAVPRGDRAVRDDEGLSRTSTSLAPNYQAGKDSLAGFKRYYKGKLVDEVYTKLGQLDYAAEIAQIRAAKPEALYVFLPGGMGINFIKQFVAAGLSKDIQLLVPGFGSDQDIIRAVGEPMLGLFDTAHWASTSTNAANRKFVAEFQKEYKRLPTRVRGAGLRHRAADRRRGARGQGQPRGQGGAARARSRPPTSRACAATSSSTATSTRSRTTTCASVGKDADGRIVEQEDRHGVHESRRCVRPGLQDEVMSSA